MMKWKFRKEIICCSLRGVDLEVLLDKIGGKILLKVRRSGHREGKPMSKLSTG